MMKSIHLCCVQNTIAAPHISNCPMKYDILSSTHCSVFMVEQRVGL